jgi:hypothetical protein
VPHAPPALFTGATKRKANILLSKEPFVKGDLDTEKVKESAFKKWNYNEENLELLLSKVALDNFDCDMVIAVLHSMK